MGIEASQMGHGEPDILRMLYRSGVRLVESPRGRRSEPTYKRAPVITTHDTKRPICRDRRAMPALYTAGARGRVQKAVGLSAFGREILKLSNELGVVTDLSTSTTRVFDVMELSTKPVIVSHTGVFSSAPLSCIRTIRSRLLPQRRSDGIIFAPDFLSVDPQMHARYFSETYQLRCGPGRVDYVAIGTDYDGGVERRRSETSSLSI